MPIVSQISVPRPGPGARLAALALAVLVLLPASAWAVRLKDVATFGGVRANQLVGYGLVVGLSGTGDKSGSQFTVQSVASMLEKMGVAVDKSKLKPKNVAAVMVTAKMPVSARPGTSLDVTVSSLGDSQSLLGGVLLLTPLRGVDGNVYALAQGPLALGGISAQGAAATAQKNITTVGSIPNGATVERGVPFQYNAQDELTLNMNMADFTTTMNVVDSINNTLGQDFARAEDITTIRLSVPQEFRGNLVPLMASLENLEVTPDGKARVVVDEKTGTVVLGRNVRLTRVAVAHGNLQIVVQESADVSQPGPFSSGQTVATAKTDVNVSEDRNNLVMMEGATLQELIDGLNAIGATPRDLISILKSLKAAGALHAELEVM
ncbi:flagellar basal body P-ring protein FlgI [Desulfocurvus sp.]|jgi:flagellar P-ring protein precursor FlgI|uniref:flagellar basal body P-ring protein FlgI n=1 Tax=Desulfocurvus sp. TaxID=2871698 RepID=UPI0025BFEA04|nr:flagellar basal body P-ring protein FlgI [Desulfocurvus sp.]MCK9239176.1 flagellar basal body P-ring protein FlgI [Desulfocurvus sp.]